MKYRNFLLLVMVLLGCVLSCEDELETSPPSQEVYVSNFGISSARRYFESTVLAFLQPAVILRAQPRICLI